MIEVEDLHYHNQADDISYIQKSKSGLAGLSNLLINY